MMIVNPSTAMNIRAAICSPAAVALASDRCTPSISPNRIRFRSIDSISRSCSQISRGISVTEEGSAEFISQSVNGRLLLDHVIRVLDHVIRAIFFTTLVRHFRCQAAASRLVRAVCSTHSILRVSKYEIDASVGLLRDILTQTIFAFDACAPLCRRRS
jgi:hypothetical protein